MNLVGNCGKHESRFHRILPYRLAIRLALSFVLGKVVAPALSAAGSPEAWTVLAFRAQNKETPARDRGDIDVIGRAGFCVT